MTASPTTATTPRAPTYTLDGLAARSDAELDAIYRAGRVPSSMHAADGALIGRMLAIRNLPGPIAHPVRRWAGSSSFLWEGKTFQASSDDAGVGHNRIYVNGVLGHQNLFPFATSFGPSALDGKPTLILDYDLAVNPGFIRAIHDEIREVSPGIFLGPAMFKRRHDKLLVLWFALDATHGARKDTRLS